MFLIFLVTRPLTLLKNMKVPKSFCSCGFCLSIFAVLEIKAAFRKYCNSFKIILSPLHININNIFMFPKTIKLGERGALFHIFANIFNVWLNRI